MSIFSKVQGFFINSNVSLPNQYNTVGYVGTDVPEEYIITILSRQSAPNGNGKITVRAILQDEIQMRTGSKWESFIDVVRNSQVGNAFEFAAQLVKGVSLQSAVTSRRIWRGTEPITLTLNLRFEEEYDSKREVMEACEALQCMCLPGESRTGKLLIPPGPSPFINDFINFGDQNELISIYVGKVLSFTNVIIKDVQVNFKNKIGTDGLFKAAIVAVTFETYEIVTKNRLRSSNPGDSGVYSQLGISNSQRYDPQSEGKGKASGFEPNIEGGSDVFSGFGLPSQNPEV